MMPVSIKGSGQCVANVPDACKTPPPPPGIPVPYPNIAQCSMASGVTKKVSISNHPVIVATSKIDRTMGDELGVLKGVVSQDDMGSAQFKKGSSKVQFDGGDVVTATMTTAHNGSNANAPMGTVLPGQMKVLAAM